MDYFSKFLRTGSQTTSKAPVDHAQEFNRSWDVIKETLMHPDERQLTKGIASTNVPEHLRSMVNSLVWESSRIEEGGTGACMEYLLKNDVLGTLVRLSESDRPSGIQAEVLRAVQNMVVLLDEQFLVHSAVHRAILRLLRNCVGDDLQEQLDGRNKVMGAARNAVRSQSSEYEEDLVNLLCILCSRIRTYRELLMIFFHDKHWYRSEPLFSVDEDDEEDEQDEEEEDEKIEEEKIEGQSNDIMDVQRAPSPSPSQATITSGKPSTFNKKPEYEFLLFNYLLRFVHREGQIGEFARAGLLFLMDVAMSPGETGQSISHSDKSTSSNTPVQDPVNDAALALAEYIIDGDFSDVLGAGLGAVYSLLPSKIEFFHDSSPTASVGHGMTLGSAGPETQEDKEKHELELERSRELGIEDTRNPDFKSRLDHFLKLLEFIQDIVHRKDHHDNLNASSLLGSAIVQSILDAMLHTFLENVLYPSILECSDSDGSAVAVMSYIEIMIRTLEDGPLSNTLVTFLLDEDNEDTRSRQRTHKATVNLNDSMSQPSNKKSAKMNRRKSSAMLLLEMEAPDSRKRSEYVTSIGRYTLKDLLMANLRSKSHSTATSALQLLRSMLIHHPQVTIDRILLVTPDGTATSFPHPGLNFQSLMQDRTLRFDDDTRSEDSFDHPGGQNSKGEDASPQSLTPAFYQPSTTYSTHEREMGLYLSLVSRIDPFHNGDIFSTGYEHYLRDAIYTIQSQAVYQKPIADGASAEGRENLKHRLNVEGPVLSLILESMRKFFSNTPELNVALTGVLATLSLHPDRSLAGWLTFTTSRSASPLKNSYGDVYDGDGDDRSVDFEIEEKMADDVISLPAAVLDEHSQPILHVIFNGLVAQLERYRQLVENFDKYLLERRQGLLFSETLKDALNLVLEITDEPTKIGVPVEIPKQTKKMSASSSIVSFLSPRKSRPAKPNPQPEPAKREESTAASASPFGPHYQRTNSIMVEPFVAPALSPWKGLKKVGNWEAGGDDVFSASYWTDKTEEPQESWEPSTNQTTDTDQAPTKITLSRLLDNMVILEESIKELVSIIHARRSLGIDSLRYL